MKNKIKFTDENTYRVVYGGVVTIRYSVNEKLMKQCKELKRTFKKEFKDWFIWMKANFDKGLFNHGEICDLWYLPAMRLQCPGIRFEGIDY